MQPLTQSPTRLIAHLPTHPRTHEINKSLTRSPTQSATCPRNQLLMQSAIMQPSAHATGTIHRLKSTTCVLSHSTNLPPTHTISHSINHTLNHSLTHSLNQSITYPSNLSPTHTITHSHPCNHPSNQSVFVVVWCHTWHASTPVHESKSCVHSHMHLCLHP